VFFGQKATRIMDSPSGDKRKIFEDILSGIIGDINDLHGKVSNDRSSKMWEIQLLTNKVSKLECRVEALRRRNKELGENEEKAEKLMQSKITEIRLRIQGLKNQIEEEDAQKVRSENRVVELLDKKKTVSEKLKVLRHKYDIDLLEKRFIDIKARK